MGIEEIATKRDLAEMERRIMEALADFHVKPERAGVRKNVHFHMARHSFGTLSLEHGADIYTISKLMGHRSIATTQVYTKVLDAGRKKAVDSIPEI